MGRRDRQADRAAVATPRRHGRPTLPRGADAETGKPIGPPLQHQGAVRAVALSADGKIALTGSYDKTARLWEAANGKPIGPPLQHHGEVLAVALSADGKTALTGSRDETARLWDTATGKQIGPPQMHQALGRCRGPERRRQDGSDDEH